jgi:hypothetical protein
MKTDFTKAEQYESIRLSLDRISPHVLTQIDKPENQKLFQKILPTLGPYQLIVHMESPKWLFNFIKEHKSELIIVQEDIFSKSKPYRDIIEGAIGSNTDTGKIWPIRYKDEPELYFTGKMILCTSKSRKQISGDKKFEYFERDCLFV